MQASKYNHNLKYYFIILETNLKNEFNIFFLIVDLFHTQKLNVPFHHWKLFFLFDFFSREIGKNKNRCLIDFDDAVDLSDEPEASKESNCAWNQQFFNDS